MKLPTPIVEILPCPSNILNYLKDYISYKDWDDKNLLTKEQAFFDQSYRYEAVTPFFKATDYYYSNLPPSNQITQDLKIYTDYLLTVVFPDYKLFRCQLVCLKPGQNVYPHIDPRYYHRYGKRIHLPLKINRDSWHIHFIPERDYEMQFSKMSEGVITDFDNITPHSAFNYGDSNRIHIICDIVPNLTYEKMVVALDGNPNATDPKTVEEYHFHLQNIEKRYNCDYKSLKPHYIEKMPSYES